MYSASVTVSNGLIPKWLRSPQYGFLFLFNVMRDFSFPGSSEKCFGSSTWPICLSWLHCTTCLDQSLSTSRRSCYYIEEVWNPHSTLCIYLRSTYMKDIGIFLPWGKKKQIERWRGKREIEFVFKHRTVWGPVGVSRQCRKTGSFLEPGKS